MILFGVDRPGGDDKMTKKFELTKNEISILKIGLEYMRSNLPQGEERDLVNLIDNKFSLAEQSEGGKQ